MSDIRAYILDQNRISGPFEQLTDSISERYESRFRTSRLKQQQMNALASGLLLSRFADIGPSDEISCNENGKPSAEGKCFFSLSHSDQYTVLAVSDCFQIGIDIEKTGRVTPAIIRKVSRIDTAEMTELELAYEWTRVEAMLKQKGTGFYADPLMLNRDEFFFSSCEYKDHCISCACCSEHGFELSEVSIELLNNKLLLKADIIYRKDDPS